MRSVMIHLFLVCLLVLGIGYLAFGHDGTHTTSEPHAHPENATSWDATFETFYELLKTDPEAARLELQSVAKELFNGHALTEEWIELFYRISLKSIEQSETESPMKIIPDVTRTYELGLEMLTAMDTEKYAEEIQLHREALAYYTELAEFIQEVGGESLGSKEVSKDAPSDAQEEDSQPVPELSEAEQQEQRDNQQLMEKFYELLPTDPAAARKELNIYAARSYQGHPLTEEWTELIFRISSEGEATVSEVTRFLETTKQIRTDMDPEKYAEEIKTLEDNLAQLKMVAKIYESQGRADAKIPFNMAASNKQDDKRVKQEAAADAPKVSHQEKIGKPAPDFQVIDLKGQELSLKKYRGQVVLLDFWATWCFPCRVEIPHIKKVYDTYKDQQFEVIGISLDQTRSVLDSYIEKQDITWPQLLEGAPAVAKMYNVTGIPATFLIDGEGIVRRVKLRGRALEAAVAELVKENLEKQAE